MLLHVFARTWHLDVCMLTFHYRFWSAMIKTLLERDWEALWAPALGLPPMVAKVNNQ